MTLRRPPQGFDEISGGRTSVSNGGRRARVGRTGRRARLTGSPGMAGRCSVHVMCMNGHGNHHGRQLETLAVHFVR